MALLRPRYRARHRLPRQRPRPHLRFLRGRHSRLSRQQRTLRREHLKDRGPHLDRALQERPGGGYQPHAVVGAHARGDRGTGAQGGSECDFQVEEGEAVDFGGGVSEWMR